MNNDYEKEFIENLQKEFEENFEKYKAKKLYNSDEYKSAKAKVKEIKDNCKNVELLFEKQNPIALNKEEIEKIIEILKIEEDLEVNVEKMAFKLGFIVAVRLLI